MENTSTSSLLASSASYTTTTSPETTKTVEWEQFLYDVRDYFKASLETSEYENASNLFFVTAAEATEQLLTRCEQLLAQCTSLKKENDMLKASEFLNHHDVILPTILPIQPIEGNTSYLDMTAANHNNNNNNNNNNNKSSGSKENMHEGGMTSCSVEPDRHDMKNYIGNLIDNDDDDDDEDDPDIYDVCHVISVDERQKVIINHDSEHHEALKDCPYKDLPAGHLAIHKSTKYGQLQRIEKRLFFEQSKKYYCGILQDWLLCYAEGPTASHPSATLYLKSPGIEIEHWGENKRRDICFQVTTADPNKKFIFQANNEVDAKEWIHAIEPAIRGESGAVVKTPRKLPTPPVIKKLVFVSDSSSNRHHHHHHLDSSSVSTDDIYEEPTPLYQLDVVKPTEVSVEGPELPEKNDMASAMKYDNYDIPKCPPQPYKIIKPTNDVINSDVFGPLEAETVGLLNCHDNESTVVAINTQQQKQQQQQQQQQQQHKNETNLNDKQDFQAKLSSQLAAGPKKAVKKNNSWCDGDNSLCSPIITAKEQKKQKKSNTPNSSPQKTGNNSDSNNSSTNMSAEKSAKNWFLNRINKSTGSMRISTSMGSNMATSPTKCKQSEKENLLNGLDNFDNVDSVTTTQHSHTNGGPTSPILKSLPNNSSGKSKVNMIINQFESSNSGHMFSVETLASNALASFTAFCNESNDCGNYEPIMTSPSLSSFMKKV